jgi:prepilin-type N-terminal cleavage/methylation domain-containing protein
MKSLLPNRRGFSLVEILVVTLLLALLGVGLAYFYLGKGGVDPATGKRKVTPITRARDTECQSNLNQIRLSLQTAQIGQEDENQFPTSLQELKLPAGFTNCPDGKEPYQYDSQTGRVRCVHPGHDRF